MKPTYNKQPAPASSVSKTHLTNTNTGRVVRNITTINTSGNAKIKQQIFSKTDGNNTYQQQQQHNHNQPTTTASLPIMNAPTSLTNLAQLSGMTLLPISKTNSTELIQIRKVQTDHNNSPNQLQGRTVNRTTNNITKQPSYNLSSIPSIQLLNNQTSTTTTEAIQTWRTNNLMYQARATSSTNSHNIDSIIPKTKRHTTNTALQPNYESLMEPCADVYGDMNNISLVKLMAILNNPALTVTAVGARNPSNPKPNMNNKSSPEFSNTDYIQQSSQITNLLDNHQISKNLPNESNRTHVVPKTDYVKEQSLQANLAINDKKSKSASFLSQPISTGNCFSPGSKQNIPTIGATIRNINDSNFVNSRKDIPNFKSIDSREHIDPQLRWLSNYNSSGSTTSNNSQPASITWSSSSNYNIKTKESTNCQLIDKMNNPIMLSTSVRNLMMQQLPSEPNRSAVSVQLLKHIDNQTKDNSWTHPANRAQKSVLEPECILGASSRNIQPLSEVAKRVESLKTVTTSSVQQKVPKKPLRTTKNRLYVPRSNVSPRRDSSISKFTLNGINIDGDEVREVLVSERHHMLDLMMSNGSEKKQKSAIPEPDEIFINRSKRIMSKIDTMIERKKKRRFERISGRSAPKTSPIDVQLEESEDEWSSDDDTQDDTISFIKTQLPLNEFTSEEKRNNLMSVGLLSRDDRNKLMVEQCQERMKIFSPLSIEQPPEVAPDIKRFVSTMIKTGGTDVEMRIESNIKRNDLPLLEGLNRNTGRLKMNYMNVLGLEKRSKRTTLYKVKVSENLGFPAPKVFDLNNKSKGSQDSRKSTDTESGKLTTIDSNLAIKKSILTSCREAMKPPDKSEYMKSLGLMAS